MRRLNHEQGFTIIELMIATTILSMILLLATVIITNIGNLYMKGINQTNTQNDARSIVDEISQHLEASNGYSTNTHNYGGTTVSSYCIGNTEYSYIPGKQVDVNSVYHVLWRSYTTDPATCYPVDITQATPLLGGVPVAGAELIGSHSSLTRLTISPPPSPYQVTVGVAFGDTTLQSTDTQGNPNCKGGKDSRFCATSLLTTTVVQRL